MSLNITINTIPHEKQAYNTLGNYGTTQGKEWFQISDMGDWKMEFLVAIHELIEAALCKHRGIKIGEIDRFDIQFERDRDHGAHGQEDEPGDDYEAPYRNEHLFACGIEQLLCSEFGIPIKTYDAIANNTSRRWRKKK